MKDAVALFTELGARLSLFGKDDESRRVIDRACEANGWFTPEIVGRAVAALCAEMLRPEKLKPWLAAYPLPVPRRRVLVVMAGNIPLVGFFDLLCVVAAGCHCVVKPSGKDFVLIEYVVRLLQRVEPRVSISFYDGIEPVDAVIATGSDNAGRYFKSHFHGVPTLLRGSRQSVAVLSGRETEAQLRGLSDDVFAYSGLGCRNVSLLFVPRGYEVRLQVPPMGTKYCNNYRQEKALLEITGGKYLDMGVAVLTECRAFPSVLSRINYAFYDSLPEVEAWLAEHDSQLQCVVAECMVHSRRVDFGQAQSPALTDYPDERDVIRFLLEI